MIEGILIFVVVSLVAATLFTVWIIATIVRLIARACAPRPRQLATSVSGAQRCGNPHCLTDNPPNARFCRRCGQSLPMLMKILPSAAA